MDTQLYIEALIFASQKPIATHEIIDILYKQTQIKYQNTEIESFISKSIQKYDSTIYPFGIYQLAGGFQFLSKNEYQEVIGTLIQHRSKKRLSKSALETLSIIAYKQPITKSEIEQVRGVSSDYAVQKLLEKELIIIKGKSEAIGRPIIYGTSPKFLEHFGINSLKDLPLPKDFAEEENTIGNQNA